MARRSSTRNSEKISLSVAYDERSRETPWTSVTVRDAVTVRKNEMVVSNRKKVCNEQKFVQFQVK